MQRGRSVRHAQRVTNTAIACEIALEPLDEGAARNPRERQGIRDVLVLVAPKVRLGPRNEGRGLIRPRSWCGALRESYKRRQRNMILQYCGLTTIWFGSLPARSVW